MAMARRIIKRRTDDNITPKDNIVSSDNGSNGSNSEVDKNKLKESNVPVAIPEPPPTPTPIPTPSPSVSKLSNSRRIIRRSQSSLSNETEKKATPAPVSAPVVAPVRRRRSANSAETKEATTPSTPVVSPPPRRRSRGSVGEEYSYSPDNESIKETEYDDPPFVPDAPDYYPQWSKADDVKVFNMAPITEYTLSANDPSLPDTPPPPRENYIGTLTWLLSTTPPEDQPISPEDDPWIAQLAMELFLGQRPDIMARYEKSHNNQLSSPDPLKTR